MLLINIKGRSPAFRFAARDFLFSLVFSLLVSEKDKRNFQNEMTPSAALQPQSDCCRHSRGFRFLKSDDKHSPPASALCKHCGRRCDALLCRRAVRLQTSTHHSDEGNRQAREPHRSFLGFLVLFCFFEESCKQLMSELSHQAELSLE